jgi:hypothetical protein
MQKSKIFFIIAIICLLGSVFSLALTDAQAASASQATNMTVPLNFTPQIGIPDSEFQANTEMPVGQYNANTKKMSSDLLPKYIEALYKYGLAIAGILAAIVLMGGGVLWLASGGSATQITKAKELMTGSIVGLIIIFCSWIILNTINPALLEFRPLSIDYLSYTPVDVDDGFLDDLENAPEDMTYGWVCMNSVDQRCENTDPPTISLNINICYNESPSNARPDNCPYGQLWCCGKSATAKLKQDSYCPQAFIGAGCKVTMTSIGWDGYCQNDQCNPCKKIGETCSGGNKDYECIQSWAIPFCGTEGGQCSCNILGNNCTCK